MTAEDRGIFVGRAHELAMLGEICQRAQHGAGPACAVVLGDPRRGKSRLLAELDRQGRDGERIWMSGYEAEQRVPLAAGERSCVACRPSRSRAGPLPRLPSATPRQA